MTDIPTIPATVTKIEFDRSPLPRYIVVFYVPTADFCGLRFTDNPGAAMADVRRAYPLVAEAYLIDTQPEPQPANNEAVIAELEKLVPKMCQCCASGYELMSTAVGDYYHAHRGGNSTSHCFSSSIHARIAELRGEK